MSDPLDPTGRFASGLDAIRQGAWEEARAHFQAAIDEHATAEAHEQLGLAAWWLDDAELTICSRERAYQLYRERQDALGAARVAVWLVWDHVAFRGNSAVSSGWLQRARRILAGHENAPEFGWLLVREGEAALFREHDPETARENGRRCAALGRSLADHDLEFIGLALEGLACVSSGDVAGGMRCLDEALAAATAGEVKALATVGVVCCWQMLACEMVRDYDRAAQWCARVREFTRRWRLRPLTAVCRTQYAGVQIWRGEWAEAEAELTTAVIDFERSRPPMVGQALARLGDLRYRQGRFEEARALFERAVAHPLARLGQAALALEAGNCAEAAAVLGRFLSQVTEREPTLRSGALELLVRARLACGDHDGATHALNELRAIARAAGTAPLAASLAAAEGLVLRERGQLPDAAAALEHAVELYQRCGAPFETAHARLALARVLDALDHPAEADRHGRAALAALQALGAHRFIARDAAPDEEWPADIVRPAPPAPAPRGAPVTGRQAEILRLIAGGLSNGQIAASLRLSEHTVKRHIANLLTRLGLSSRAAAVAHAARLGLI